MQILNLGCGIKTSKSSDMVNIDWSIYLRISTSRLGRTLAHLFLDKTRLSRLRALPQNIKVHNLAKGIPFEDGTTDAVYHSHVLEHLDRPIAEQFLQEAMRVLKLGGIIRVVVPDFEVTARAYLDHVALCENDSSEIKFHDCYLAAMIEQSVRREAYGTSKQSRLRRFVENKILGGARQRGETHQWMYDRFSLQATLQEVGYQEIKICHFDESSIQGWNDYGLDLNEDGSQYKTDSLYVEGRKGRSTIRKFTRCASTGSSTAPEAVLHQPAFAFMGSNHTANFPFLDFAGWRLGATSNDISLSASMTAVLLEVPPVRLWVSTLPTFPWLPGASFTYLTVICC